MYSKMYKDCVQNFLNKSDPSCVDRHSDSSDFETPTKIPAVFSKSGVHNLKSKKSKSKTNRHKSNQLEVNNCYLIERRKTDQNEIKKLEEMAQVHNDDTYLYRHHRIPLTDNIKRKHGDVNRINLEKISEPNLPDKLLSLTTLIQYNNQNRKLDTEPGNGRSGLKNKIYFCKCHRKKIRKSKHDRDDYTVRPVYIVERNDLQQTLCANINKSLRYDERDNNCNIGSLSFTDTELEIRTHQKEISQVFSMKEKEHKDSIERISKKNIYVQHPSKTQFSTSYQIYDASCDKCVSTESKENRKLNSSSSAFWKFLANKVSKKYPKSNDYEKPCECINNTAKTCFPETCENYNNTDKAIYNDVYQETPSFNITFQQKENNKEINAQCKCKLNRLKSSLKTSNTSNTNVDTGPCREVHDDIAKAVAAKYNGEILCIHNPPCIVINGCLNMPPARLPMQSSFWPVIEPKKRSFGQVCKKKKRSKQKSCDQSSQYYPLHSQVEACLPEFKMEKEIQSQCNHNPPCQYVHSCNRSKYDPKLENSCIDEHQSRNYVHEPRCTELPLCSKKYIILNVEENLKEAKMKLVCKHNPPCLLIPKCLAKFISKSVQVKAIPDCRHFPYCELIPVCCGKAAKDESSPSISDAPCRIV